MSGDTYKTGLRDTICNCEIPQQRISCPRLSCFLACREGVKAVGCFVGWEQKTSAPVLSSVCQGGLKVLLVMSCFEKCSP